MTKRVFTDESLAAFIEEVKKYTNAEITDLVNSAPETLDTLGELAAAFEGNQDMISLLDASITNKKNIPALVNGTAESFLSLNDNTEYRLSDITSLTLSYPDGNFEVWLKISFSSTGSVDVTFPDETRFIGASPTFGNGQTWEISIKDGAAICWRVA